MNTLDYEYNSFNEETRKYLNKVMEIYAAIKDKPITRNITKLRGFDPEEFTYSKTDKIVLAFFIAGFFVKGNLNNIYSQHDDIKLDDLFNFANLKEEEIRPLVHYKKFYNEELKLMLTTMISDREVLYTIKRIIPETIVWSLQFTKSKILDYFRNEFENSISLFYEHPIFDDLHSYLILNDTIEKKDLPKNNNRFQGITDLLILDLDPDIIKPSNKINNDPLIMPDYMRKVEELTGKKSKKGLVLDDKLWDKLDQIQKKFIGQERLVEDLFYTIVNNQRIIEGDKINDGERSIVFLDGPSGTGKTAIASDIAANMGLPFIVVSAKEFSDTGYVGGDLEDILKQLLEKANDDLELAEKGIVVIDEIGKLASDLKMSQAVQHGLLKLLGGGKYTLSSGFSLFLGKKGTEFDTSKLTFICLEALTDLRNKKTNNKRLTGFGENDNKPPVVEKYTINPQDLINIGLEKELVGRFNTYLHTDDYSVETLERILRESTISPLLGFKNLVESYDKSLVINDEIYHLIAEQSYELNTGARSLQTIMNNVRTKFLKQLMRGKDKTVYLTPEVISKSFEDTMTRKGRG